MKDKILAMTIRVLNDVETKRPTSAATRAGMELALIALHQVLNRIEYFNAGTKLQRLQMEMTEQQRVAEAQEHHAANQIHDLKRQNADLITKGQNQRHQLEQQKQALEAANRRLHLAQKQTNEVSTAARLAASGNHVRQKPTQRPPKRHGPYRSR